MNSYQKRKQEIEYYKQRCKELADEIILQHQENHIIYLSPEERLEAQEAINKRRTMALVNFFKPSKPPFERIP